MAVHRPLALCLDTRRPGGPASGGTSSSAGRRDLPRRCAVCQSVGESVGRYQRKVLPGAQAGCLWSGPGGPEWPLARASATAGQGTSADAKAFAIDGIFADFIAQNTLGRSQEFGGLSPVAARKMQCILDHLAF